MLKVVLLCSVLLACVIAQASAQGGAAGAMDRLHAQMRRLLPGMMIGNTKAGGGTGTGMGMGMPGMPGMSGMGMGTGNTEGMGGMGGMGAMAGLLRQMMKMRRPAGN